MTAFTQLVVHKDGLNRVPANTDELAIQLATTSLTTELSLTGDMSISGNLDVSGNIIARDEERVLVQDNFLDVNFGYTGTNFESGGIAVNYKAVAGGLTIDASSDNLTFVADAGSGAKVTGTALQIPAATFADGDIIQIHGTSAAENDGFYVVDGANAAGEIVFKSAPNFKPAQVDVTSESDAGTSITIFQITATSLEVDSNGLWKTATGDSDADFATLNDLGSSSLQEAYEIGNTINTSALEGDVLISGTQKLEISAANGLLVGENSQFSKQLAVGGQLTVSGLSALNGGINVNSGKLIVDAANGNLTMDGILDVGGAGDINGDFSVATSKFTVAAATGNTAVDGTLDAAGDFAVATNKFTVAALSGNTLVAGTLTVAQAGEFDNSLGADGDFRVGAAGASNFSVAAASGNTDIQGTLDVAAAADLASTLNVQAKATLASAAVSDLTVSGGLVFSDAQGNLDDDAGLTFAGSVLTAPDLKASNLTDNQIVIPDANGKLEGDANFRFDGTNFDIGASGAEKFRVAVASGDTTIEGAADLNGTLDVAGAAEFDSSLGADGDLRVGAAGASKFAVTAATGNTDVQGTLNVVGQADMGAALNVTGLASLDGGIDVDGAFTVADASGNVNTTGTLSVTGLSTLTAGAEVRDLNDKEIVFAGVNGRLKSEAGFEYDDVGNKLSVPNLAVATEAVLQSAQVSDLTDNRIVIAGTSGALEDDANLTFDGATLVVGGVLDVSGAGDIAGNFSVATNKFSVASASGDTVVAGSLDVSGAATLLHTGGNAGAPDVDVRGYAKFSGVLDLDNSIDADLSGDMDVAAAGRIDLVSAGSDDGSEGAIHLETTQNTGSITLESATGINLRAPNRSIDLEHTTVFGYAGCITMSNASGAQIDAFRVVHVTGHGTQGVTECEYADSGSNHHPIGIMITACPDTEARPVHTVPGTRIDGLTFQGTPSEGDALYLNGSNISATAPTSGTVYRLGYCSDAANGGMIWRPQFIAQFG
jgi:hypothetical protein